MIHIISEPNLGSLLRLQKTRFDAAWIEHEEYRNRTWTDTCRNTFRACRYKYKTQQNKL